MPICLDWGVFLDYSCMKIVPTMVVILEYESN